MVDTYTTSLAGGELPLALAGGKGSALSRLINAGYRVPAGFVVTTDAYRRFVAAAGLDATIEASMALPSASDAAATIRQAIDSAPLPSELQVAIEAACGRLAREEATTSANLSVAVRSSATAEDLPELSFAGQQDTYLNVRGDHVAGAVKHCFGSLWSERAIEYRQRAGIDDDAIAMAVVVQTMVPAAASGILFTANPTSGDRDEIVVNAGYGLGEGIVGGEITPDTYIVDRATRQTVTVVVGDKEHEVRARGGGDGTIVEAVPEHLRESQALRNDTISALAALALAIEAAFDDEPQDIEWATTEADELIVLQSRPITKLPPPPLKDVVWATTPAGGKLVRRQVVENMPEPLSTLFEDAYLTRGLESAIDDMLSGWGFPYDASILITRPMFVTVHGYGYCHADYRFPLRQLPRIMWWYLRFIPRMRREVLPHWENVGLPTYLAEIEAEGAADSKAASDQDLLSTIQRLAAADARYWFAVSIVMGAAKMADGALHYFLTRFAKDLGATSGTFLRGFGSKTLEAEQSLREIAAAVEGTAAAKHLVETTSGTDLLTALMAEPEAGDIVTRIQAHLARFGHQVFTLDFMQPTLEEDPVPLMMSLKDQVSVGTDDLTHAEKTIRAREAATEAALAKLGPLRRWLFRKLVALASALGPDREEALFHMGAAWPVVRRAARELGERLTASGTLVAPSDVFHLTLEELERACAARSRGNAMPDLGKLAADRVQLRESRKALHPPPMVPEDARLKFGIIDMTAFETQKRNAADTMTLEGFAVSPGAVTAKVSVIMSQDDFPNMEPGTILVCPTTTPAWTPLFSRAVGLVTDIGGILAHGSIVAREYGIPAVMGTGNITKRVANGQEVTVDGTAGTVTIGEVVES